MSNVLAPICFSELQKELFEGRGEIVKYCISTVPQDCNITKGYGQIPYHSEMGFAFSYRDLIRLFTLSRLMFDKIKTVIFPL
jgi:hypothetical protein